MHRPAPTGQVSLSTLLAAAAASTVACGAALAQQMEVIFTKIPTHPTSIVPGALNMAGQSVETRWRAIDDIIVSPDGSRWMLKGRTQQGSDEELICLMGSGNSGTMWLQEGQPVPAGQPGELIDFFGSGLGRFDDNNRFAMSLRARGGTNAIFQKIIVWDGEEFTLPFHMGTPLQELVDNPPNPSGDELFGNSVGSIHLLNTGRIGSHDTTIQNCHSTRRPALFYDTISFHQINVTNVLGLDGVTLETWLTMDANKFYTTPDGNHWYAQGRMVGMPFGETCLVYDGQIRLRTGFPVEPGSPVVVNAVHNTELASNGNWYTRGTDASGGVWATRNGEIVAKTGDPITPGASEHWGSTFLAFNGNSNGDWILVGTTDNPDPTRDTVVVVNGTQVIAREGDPVDVSGNGLFDDDAYIGRGNSALSAFEPNDAVITNDMMVYLILNLYNEAGEDLNSNPPFVSPQAFVRIDLGGGGPECPADWNDDGQVNSADITAFLSSWIAGDGDFNGDGLNNSADITAFLTAWLDAVQNGC